MLSDRHPFSGGLIPKRPSEAKESWNLIRNTKATTSSESQLSVFLVFIFGLNSSRAKELIKSHFGIAEQLRLKGGSQSHPVQYPSQSPELAQGSVLLSFECLSMDEHPTTPSGSFQCPTTLMEELPSVQTNLPPLTKKTLMLTSLYLMSVKPKQEN